MSAKLPVVTSEPCDSVAPDSVPPPPRSYIRLTGSYALHDDDVPDADVMFHPACEATSCQNCAAYADRSCALLYGLR